MRVLDEIGLRFGTDKASHHHDFLRFYERRLGHLRDQSFVLLEIGVQKGGSLRSWSEFFPAARIVGMDVDRTCEAIQANNIAIRVGDASDADFLLSVIEEFGRPTVVIDDGSHRWDHQILALQVLFPALRPGGFFIMEDLDTSFSGHLEQAPFEGTSNISTFSYLSLLAARTVAHQAFKSESPTTSLRERTIIKWDPLNSVGGHA